MNRFVVNEETTSLWFDLWINHKSLVDLLGWSSLHLSNSKQCTVSRIIQTTDLHLESLSETREVSNAISHVKLATDNSKNYWEITNNKSFNFAQVWDTIRQHSENVNYSKLVWHKPTTKNISFST